MLIWLPLGLGWAMHLGTAERPDPVMRAAGFAYVLMGLAGIAASVAMFFGVHGVPFATVWTASGVIGIVLGLATSRRRRSADPIH